MPTPHPAPDPDRQRTLNGQLATQLELLIAFVRRTLPGDVLGAHQCEFAEVVLREFREGERP